MKKIVGSILLVLFLIPNFLTMPIYARSKTLGEIKQDLASFKAEHEENKNKQRLTEAEINQTNGNIRETERNLEKGKQETQALTNEIKELEISIKEKDSEIKEIIKFMQISEGESFYMEYVFGAKDFTDFIYRTAVTEQLTKYNDELMKQFDHNIEENNKKKEQLAAKEIELGKLVISLEKNLNKLNNVKAGLSEESLTIENEIKATEDMIKTYVEMGCKDSDTFESCAQGQLPPGTAFYRPLEYGSVTNEFGVSLWPYYGYHKGIDVSTIDNGNIPVYSSGTGTVTSVLWQQCGTNIVIIQHNIRGKYYTTAYWHLKNVHVSRGQVVTKDTRIGTMGGGYGSGDTCSTGSHVHLVMSNGLHSNTGGMHNNLVNPRQLVNFPCEGVRFDDRNSAYKC